MIVVCRPEESPMWYEKLWQNTVDLFRSLDVPVRTLECCSGDLADLKVKSVDVEAWSPRQKKYFEVGSCSNLGDAQARRLRIRVQGRGRRQVSGPHPEQYRGGSSPYADRLPGEQSSGRRQCEDTGSAASLHGRHGNDGSQELNMRSKRVKQ